MNESYSPASGKMRHTHPRVGRENVPAQTIAFFQLYVRKRVARMCPRVQAKVDRAQSPPLARTFVTGARM